MLYSALLILSALQGNPAEATQSPEQAVAPLERVVTIVGNEKITLGDVRAEVNRLVPLNFFHAKLPEEEKLSTYHQALDGLVEKALIYQDAVLRKIPYSEKELEAEFRSALTQAGPQYANISDQQFADLLKQYRPRVVRRLLIDKNEARFTEEIPAVSDPAVTERFEMIRSELVSVEEASFQHILVKVPPAATRQEGAAVRKEVDALHKKLADGADFGEMAKEYSDDIFASVGGDMGFVAKGAFSIRELDKSAFKLADGEISEVLVSLYGLHILRRNETRPSHPLTFEEVAADLRTGLEMESKSVARKAWLAEVREKIGIEELITLEDKSLPVEEGPGATTH